MSTYDAGYIAGHQGSEPEGESEGCTCCQTRTFTNYSARVLNGAECPHCGHLVRSHT